MKKLKKKHVMYLDNYKTFIITSYQKHGSKIHSYEKTIGKKDI